MMSLSPRVLGGSVACFTFLLCATFAQYPTPGVGTSWRSQIFFNPTSEILNSFASVRIGVRQTRSYSSVRVSLAIWGPRPAPRLHADGTVDATAPLTRLSGLLSDVVALSSKRLRCSVREPFGPREFFSCN